MTSTDPIVELQGITRTFSLKRQRGEGYRRHTVIAVDDMTWSIGPGEAVGYIGANGAGKSTTIKMLTGILVPTRGSVRTCGLRPGPGPAAAGPADRRRLRPALAAVVGPAGRASRSGSSRRSTISPPMRTKSRTDELVERLEMARVPRHARCGSCRSGSGCGPRSPRRCSTPRALVILDEPTIGLDVLSKQRLREFLRGRATAPTAPRCCSPPTTWATSSGCATGSSWSTAAGSPTTAPSRPLPDRRRRAGAGRRPRRAIDDLTGIAGTRHLGSRGPTACASGSPSTPRHHRRQGAGRRQRPRGGARPHRRGARHRGRRTPDLPIPSPLKPCVYFRYGEGDDDEASRRTPATASAGSGPRTTHSRTLSSPRSMPTRHSSSGPPLKPPRPPSRRRIAANAVGSRPSSTPGSATPRDPFGRRDLARRSRRRDSSGGLRALGRSIPPPR